MASIPCKKSLFYDIRNSFSDIRNSYTDIQNSFLDIRNSFSDIGKSFTDIRKSTEFPISENHSNIASTPPFKRIPFSKYHSGADPGFERGGGGSM